MRVTARVLNIIAALIWYGGGIALTLKGGSLLAEASRLRLGLAWPWLAACFALVFGVFKARYVYVRSLNRNLSRIAALDSPRIWQFYTPRFLFLLGLMIATGTTLSRLAHGDYAALLAVGALDLSIAVALLGSSYVYWKRGAFLPSWKARNP